MSCRTIRREIEEAELDQYLSDTATAHLGACLNCRTFREERAALRQLIGSVGAVSAPADFHRRVRARLAVSRSSHGRGLFRLVPAPGVPAIALAASFALLVTVAVIYKQLRFAAPVGPQQAEVAANASRYPSADSAGTQPVSAQSQTVAVESTLAQLNSGGSKSVDSSTQNLLLEQKPRNRSQRILKSVGERSLPVAVASRPRNNAVELSSQPAQVISLVAVQVPTTNQPVRVSLEDGRGATHTVSLQPVTFGSQELIERSGAARVATASTQRGIW